MLSTSKLIELNNRMLSLGVPVDRDNIGYNIPDYAVMYNIAYIPESEITDVMKYGIVDNLLHYKNTQLRDYAEDLIETKTELENTLGQNFDYKSLIRNANLKYRPRTDRDKVLDIKSVDYIKKTVTLHHEGRSQKENDFKKANYPAVKFLVGYDENFNTIFDTVVPFDKLTDYISLMMYKYIPSPELLEMYENLEGFMSKHEDEVRKQEDAEEKRIKEAHTVKKIDCSNGNIILHYDGYVNSVSDFVNSHKSDGTRWLRDDSGKWNVRIPLSLYPEFRTLLESEGFFFDGIEITETETEVPKRRFEKENPYTSPDYDSYSLPFEPYDFQKSDIDNLLSRSRALLGHDMGLGKTFISVMVGEQINEPKLVICPESLRLNWRKEIRMVNPDADVRILYSKDKYEDFKKGDWTIVGYHTAGKYGDELLREKFNCLFVDEMHNCKAVDNMGIPASKRADAAIALALNADYCYMLTGTPIPTRNKDLYNILRILDVKEIDFDNKWAFFNYGKEFCDGYNDGYGWKFDGCSNAGKLHEILSEYMIRRLKTEVLPDLTKQRIFIPSETRSREYFKLEKKLSDPDMDTDTFMGIAMSARRVLSKDKVLVAIDMAKSMLEEGRSVVIVSNFNETLDKLTEEFGDDCCSIRGGMSDTQKQKAIDDFQSGNKHVCALNIIAGGVGVTLTKAHDMIICDYDWTPSNMAQVEDRICRAGQTEPCIINYIYCENALIDELFVDMITSKSGNIDRVVDASENTMDLAQTKTDSFIKRLMSATGYAEAKQKQKEARESDDWMVEK